jgi:hypothetical protein
MDEKEDIQAARDAIGRRLATDIALERGIPEQLKVLLRELERQDERSLRIERGNR